MSGTLVRSPMVSICCSSRGSCWACVPRPATGRLCGNPWVRPRSSVSQSDRRDELLTQPRIDDRHGDRDACHRCGHAAPWTMQSAISEWGELRSAERRRSEKVARGPGSSPQSIPLGIYLRRWTGRYALAADRGPGRSRGFPQRQPEPRTRDAWMTSRDAARNRDPFEEEKKHDEKQFAVAVMLVAFGVVLRRSL